MKNNLLIRLFALMLALFALCICFASCGSSSKDRSEDAYGSYDEEIKESVNGSSGILDSEQSFSTATAPDRKVIKTFDILSETKDFEEAIATLNTLISEHGAYVESSSTSDKSLNSSSAYYTRRASYTIRVPAESAEAFVGSVGTLFNITSNASYVEDISETYYSIEARLEELQVERNSLLDILNQTETKKDYDLWLTVHTRLSDVTQQIAVYQGQLNRYDGKVAYSTVNLSINEVINYSETAGDNSFGSRLGASFKDGWNSFVSGIQTFVIWLAGALPTLLSLGLIAAVVIVIVVASCKKKK